MRIIKPESMKEMFLRLNGVFPIRPDLADQIKEKVIRKEIKKKEVMVREGQICRYIYYIEKGIVVHYSTGDKGTKATWILKENDIVTSVKSFFDQIAAYERLVALEDTIAWCISYQDWEEICKEFEDFRTISFKVQTEYYSRKEDHQKLIETTPEEDLVRLIMKEHSDLFNRVDRETLASYFGMSARTFSKYL